MNSPTSLQLLQQVLQRYGLSPLYPNSQNQQNPAAPQQGALGFPTPTPPGALSQNGNSFGQGLLGQGIGALAGSDAVWQGAGNLDTGPTLMNMGKSGLSSLASFFGG